MRTSSCRCKKCESYGSMPSPQCLKCEDCGSNYCGSNYCGGKISWHNYYQSKVQTDNGDDVLTRCNLCYKTKNEIERDAFGKLHINDTELGKKIKFIFKDYPIRFAPRHRYMLVSDGRIPSGTGNEFASKLTQLLKPLQLKLKYEGFDDNDYVFYLTT